MASAGASSSTVAVDGAVKASVPGPASASALSSPGSIVFSSQPVAPVVVNSHARRPSSDASPSSWPAKSSGTGGVNVDAASPPEADDDNNNNNSSSSSGAAATRTMQQQHSRRSSAAAPPSPYSSSDGSETSEEERNPRPKSSASAGKETGGGVQQAQTRQSSGGSAASQSLPSISGAALLQLRSSGGGSAQSLERMNSIQPAEKRGDEQYEGDASSGANAANSGRFYHRSRSRSRERPEVNVSGRWSNNTESVGGDKDVMMTSRSEDRSSFSGSSDDRELRIMFHGREIYADDLIGLRVAKTFVGHGRFLGQVVKFDEPTSLYTVVYADGDAEELSIDNTIQILIQDEIERADPSLPPVASAYAKEVYPSRPESPEITGAKSPWASSAPHPQQQQRSQVPPPSASGGPAQIPAAAVAPSAAGPGAAAVSRPRSSLQISEREAQFVVGLFENHALPVLLREGWKIQTSQSGSEQRFYAPQGNFPGAGRVFTSALAVVELIASDNELLSVCFPQNVHSAILSLFPESSRLRESSHHSRKRVPAAAPVNAEPYDMKRQRPGSRDEMMTSDRPTTSHMRPVSANRGPSPAPSSSSQQRHGGMGDQRGYRHPEDIVMEREPYAADRVPPVSSERFSGGGPSREGSRNGGVRPGSHFEEGEYRRASPGDTRGAPSHRGPLHESSGPRWSGGGSGGVRSAPSNNANPVEYRRQYADSPEWREREMPVRGGDSSQYSSRPPPSSYHEGGAGPFRSHSRLEEPPYYADRPGSSHPGDAPSGAYRYQEVSRSPVHRNPSADHFHRHGSSSSAGGRAGPPSAGLDGPPSSSSTRSDSAPSEYRNSNTGERMGRGGPPLPGRGDPGSMPPGPAGRGPSFSMMDVDRVSIPRAGVPSSAASLLEHSRAVSSDSGQSSNWENRRPSSEHSGYDQPNERSRSPRGSEHPSQAYSGSQQQRHHHRHQQQQQQQSSHHRHHHHQRVPSNGDNNSYADLNGSGGRASSADLVQEQRSTASPGSSAGGGSKQADGKRA